MSNLDQRLRHLVTTIANASPAPPTVRDIPLARRSHSWRGPLVAVATFAVAVLVFGIARWMLSSPTPAADSPSAAVTVRHQVIEFTITAELSCDQAVGAGTSTLRLETWADFGGGRFRQLATYPDGSTRDRIALGDPVNPDRSYGKGEPRLVSPRCGIDLLGGDPTDGPDIVFYDPPVRQPGSVGYQELGTLLAGTHRDSRDRPALLYRWVLDGGYGVSDDGTEYPIYQETEWYVDEATGHVLETTFRQTSELRYDVARTTVIVSDAEVQVDPALFSTDGFELEWDATTATTVASPVTTAVGPIPPESTTAALTVLDDIESRATGFLDRAYLLERAWESRQITYADAQQTLTVLATDVTAWSAEVASQSDIPVDMQPAFAVIVVEVSNLTDGVGAISAGLAAPDDGTIRRDALTGFAAGVVRVFQAVDAARGTLGANRSEADPYYSVSLDAVSVLPPFRWPWFPDGVSTPPDALAAATDLVELMTQVPALADLKVLAAERPYGDPDPALEIRWAWLKVTDTELLRIGTQLITPDTVIPQEGTVVTLPDGWSDVRTKPGSIITKLVIGDRLVLVDLTSTQGSEVLSLTADDLLAIAASIIGLA